MKKLSLLLFAILGIAFKNAPKITIGACLYRAQGMAQNVTNYSDFLSHKYYLLVTNTVGATTPSNAASVFTVSKDTTWLMLPNIKFSGVTTGSASIIPGNKIFYLNGSKMLCATDFSLVTFPYSQVTGTPVIPGIYTLTASDIYAKLTYTPYNAANPNGYISSYSEIDPLFDSKFSSKTTGNLSEGSNLYYTSSRFNSAFAGKSTSDLNEGSNLYFTAARTRTTISAGTGLSYVSGTGVITNSAPDQAVTLSAGNTDISISGSYPNFTVTPYVQTTFSVTRAINSSTFQVSSTRRCSVVYNIGISCTASIGSNAAGTLLLQYSLSGGATWLNAPEIKNSNTVTLAIALNSINVQESITAINNVPAGTIFRMVPTIVGTTTITYISGFETY